MTTPSDANTPEAPQEATDGRLSASEGSTGHTEAPEGENGAPAGADGFEGTPADEARLDRAYWTRRYNA